MCQKLFNRRFLQNLFALALASLLMYLSLQISCPVFSNTCTTYYCKPVVQKSDLLSFQLNRTFVAKSSKVSFSGDNFSQVASSGEMNKLSASPTSSTVITSTSRDLFLSREELLKNISRNLDGLGLFETIDDEEYLKNHSDFFAPRVGVDNYLDHQILIQAEDLCLRDETFLLIAIPSVIGHKEERDAIRRTWLRSSETNAWPRARVKEKVKHVFFFGYKKGSREEDLKNLLAESVFYNDIVMVDFEDSYRNLTLKMLAALRWTGNFCERAEFFLKVDEDTMINVPLMIEFLLHARVAAKSEQFVVGRKHHHEKPEVVRNKDDRWVVGDLEYPFRYYPQYMLGHSYAISRAAVPVIVSTARRIRLVAPEDAFITGIAVKTARIPRLSARSFSMCCVVKYDCDVVWNKKVAMTSLDLLHLEKLWTSVAQQSCDDKIVFLK
ncbi:unnamed protein product [Lymnaea stagnalis]|uniref:Hexosyltransferase n=1 Tax=Lymnaea stagnalis TaxID=6523 RepID=A0AAV2HD94_LYMST